MKLSRYEAEKLGYVFDVFGNEVYISGYYGESNEFIVPEEIDGKSVTCLRAFCCSDNENIESVVIPFMLDTIDSGAFENCINLRQLTITVGVRKLSKSAFDNTGLKITKEDDIVYLEANNNPYYIVLGKDGDRKDIRFNYDSRIIVTHAFEETDIEAVGVGKVEFVGDYAFASCKKLTRFSLSLHTYYLGAYALCDCDALETAVTHNITRINNGTFNGCKSLRICTLNEPLLKICVGAFYGCESLDGILFPSSLTEIADGAFSGCTSLAFAKYKDVLERNVYFEMKDYKGNVITKTIDELEQEDNGRLTKYLLDSENDYYVTKHKKYTKEDLEESILKRING